MMKVAMKIAYNGANFCGFQKQKDRQSVSGFLEEVLGVLGFLKRLLAVGGRIREFMLVLR